MPGIMPSCTSFCLSRLTKHMTLNSAGISRSMRNGQRGTLHVGETSFAAIIGILKLYLKIITDMNSNHGIKMHKCNQVLACAYNGESSGLYLVIFYLLRLIGWWSQPKLHSMDGMLPLWQTKNCVDNLLISTSSWNHDVAQGHGNAFALYLDIWKFLQVPKYLKMR